MYQWKTASYIKSDANLAGKQCEELERTVGLTPANLLNANRDESAPLHDEFEWDDATAAEEYRLSQARHIINCLCIKTEKSAEQTPIRAFFKTSSSQPYESLEVILKSSDKHAEMLQRALNELSAFEAKYRILSELQPLFDVIENFNK